MVDADVISFSEKGKVIVYETDLLPLPTLMSLPESKAFWINIL